MTAANHSHPSNPPPIQLTEITLKKIKNGQFQADKATDFSLFQTKINNNLLNHQLITNNKYTQWFSKGEISLQQLRSFIVQFSVFSNQFLMAQMHKMLNANSVDEMRASKEILINELGVVFNDPSRKVSRAELETKDDHHSFGGTQGSVEGGMFRFGAAHFELLMRMAKHLDLEFENLGKRSFGSADTLFFCDELIRLYGHEDYGISTAASYAVENWAAAGFWQDLVDGLTIFKKEQGYENLPLVFFNWHNQLEANHAHHTQEELEEYYFTHEVDEEGFIIKGNQMLDGVLRFWDGLYESVTLGKLQ